MSAPLAQMLAQLAAQESDRVRFRTQALALLAEHTNAQAGVFHALSPRVPIESGAVFGFPAEAFARALSNGDAHAVELERWRIEALAHGGVAADTEVFSQKELVRTAYYQTIAQPFGLRTCALVHLLFRGRIVSVIALFRKGSNAQPFETTVLELLRSLVPTLALGDVSYERTTAEHAPLAVQRPQCRDTRLTPREQELVELVALGQRNEDISRALGLSPNTVRNRLAVVFKKLGVANRAELVRVAVLR